MRNPPIKTKLIYLIAFTSTMLVAVGGLGLSGMKSARDSLETVYIDRLIPVIQLATIGELLSDTRREMLLVAHGRANSGNLPMQHPVTAPANRAARIEADLAEMDKIWREYLATYLTPEEKSLASSVLASYTALVEKGIRPGIALMRDNDIAGLDAHLRDIMLPLDSMSHDALEALIRLQDKVARTELARNASDNRVRLTISVIGIALAVLVGIVISAITIRSVTATANRLRESEERAEAANRAKSEFLSNMSHEMRTPLTGISGVIDLLLTNGLTDQQRHFLNMAKSSADSLTQLINNMLDFSRIEAGEIGLLLQPFNLRGCVRAATDIFAMEVDRKGLRFTLEIDDGVPEMVVGDAGRLRLVLVNLLANAVKFTEHGEIDVSVRPAPDPAQPGQDVLLFTVRDTGVGISASYLENIFEKFTQAEASLSRKYGGAGIGLALTKRIVENMGGEIRVESRPGEGSVFFFSIPFVRPT